MNITARFEIGKTYGTSSTCDHECIYTGKVIKRTAKTVTFDLDCFGVRTVRINKQLTEWNHGAESVYPLGYHSMCPVFDATDIIAV